jgi:hypothetical protein
MNNLNNKLTIKGTTDDGSTNVLELKNNSNNIVFNINTGGDINQIINKYFYNATSLTADTIGDLRTIWTGTNWIMYYCTVGSATKGAGTWVTIATISSTGKLTINEIASLKVSDQTGTGDRIVTSNTGGTQSAVTTIKSAYITDNTTTTLLTTPANWNGNIYTGTTLDMTYAYVGAKYTIDINYYYEIGNDGLPFRISKS